MAQNAVTPATQDRKPLPLLMRALSAFLLALSLALVPTIPAQAASYSIARHTCHDVKPITSSIGFGSGVNFTLADHPNTTVMLATRFSWGWTRGVRGNATPGRVDNQYHVRFLDASGRVLWTEWNSVRNGGSRWYSVGGNVRTIQVTSNGYPFLGGNWAIRPAVGICFN